MVNPDESRPGWAGPPLPDEPLVWQPETVLFARMAGQATVKVEGEEEFGTVQAEALLRVDAVLEFIRVETGRGYALIRLIDGRIAAWPLQLLEVGRA